MFEYLHAAFEERDPWLTHIGASRIMASYRDEDRFQELLRSMNLYQGIVTSTVSGQVGC